MDGKATFTIVVSRTIIRSPRQRTMRAHQRFRPAMLLVMLISPYRVAVNGRCGACKCGARVETARTGDEGRSRGRSLYGQGDAMLGRVPCQPAKNSANTGAR